MAAKVENSAGMDNIDEIALAANAKFIFNSSDWRSCPIAINGEVVTIHNSTMMPKSIRTGCY